MYVLQWIMLHRKYVYEIMILCYGLRDYATMNYAGHTSQQKCKTLEEETFMTFVVVHSTVHVSL